MSSRSSQDYIEVFYPKCRLPPFCPPGPLNVKSRELRKKKRYLEVGTSCTSILSGSGSGGFDVTTGTRISKSGGHGSHKLTPLFRSNQGVGTPDLNANAPDANAANANGNCEGPDCVTKQECDPETEFCYIPAIPGEDIYGINGQTSYTTCLVHQLPFITGHWLRGPLTQESKYKSAFSNGPHEFTNGPNATTNGPNAPTNGPNAFPNEPNAVPNGPNALPNRACAFPNGARPRRRHQCPYFENENSNCECPAKTCHPDKCWWRERSCAHRKCHVIPLSKPDFAPPSFGYGQKRKTLENTEVATETLEKCDSLTFPPGVLLCNCLRKAKREKCCPCNKRPPEKPKKERQLSEFLSFQDEEDEYLRKIHKLYHPSEGGSEEASEHEDATEEKTESEKIKCEEDEEGCHEDHEEEETLQSTLSHKSGSQKSPKSPESGSQKSQKSSLKSQSKSGSGSGSKKRKRSSQFSSDYGGE